MYIAVQYVVKIKTPAKEKDSLNLSKANIESEIKNSIAPIQIIKWTLFFSKAYKDNACQFINTITKI